MHRRNLIWKAGSIIVFKLLRNQANHSPKSLKSQYCHNRIEHLKIDSLHKWWHDVKTLCGLSANNNNCLQIITECDAPVYPSILPDAINKHFNPINVDALDYI